MAGGKGSRLRPLTENVPKPLLKIGDKPIIEQNIDRLSSYGISNFWISINYLGEQIENYFKNGKNKDKNLKFFLPIYYDLHGKTERKHDFNNVLAETGTNSGASKTSFV